MAANGPVVALLRHGETEWSRSGRHTGSTDIPLTPAGEDQARAAGPLLGRLAGPAGWDLVVSSPRRRALRTVELAGVRVDEIDDDLAEWDYGDLEGRTSADIRGEFPDWSIWRGPWPGGETATEVSARVDRLLARVRSAPAASRVLLVAHGHLLRVLGARWIDQPAASGRWLTLDTAAVCELGWEHDGAAIRRWNLTAP